MELNDHLKSKVRFHLGFNAGAQIPAGDRLQTIRVRKGQPEFRKALLKKIPYCPVTTVTDDRLLEACHIKPRSKCSQVEQSDSNNGIMLTRTIHQ